MLNGPCGEAIQIRLAFTYTGNKTGITSITDQSKYSLIWINLV